MACVWIGTSGWSYAHWTGGVYPRGLEKGAWLAHYATLLSSVEINATFYRLPGEPLLRRWSGQTPPDFLFAVKAWCLITHFRRLSECEGPLATFLARIQALGEKRGPVLFQLPPRLAVDLPRLEAFLELLPSEGRWAFEFRNPSWHTERVYAALAARNAAFCPFELAERRSPRLATADFIYVRLHGRAGRYRGAYGEPELAEWADWLGGELAQGRDVHLYFDNTDEGDCAVRNARRLAEMLSAGI